MGNDTENTGPAGPGEGTYPGEWADAVYDRVQQRLAAEGENTQQR